MAKRQSKDDYIDILDAKLKFIVGVCLSFTLTGIIFAVLYSLIHVTQPMNASAPNDEKFFELIQPIATFLTGTLSGIMLTSTRSNSGRKREEDEEDNSPVGPATEETQA
jgi:hypothetical protein